MPNLTSEIEIWSYQVIRIKEIVEQIDIEEEALTCNLTYTFLASSVVGLYSEGHRATLVTRYDSPEILNVHSLNIHIARVALL